MAQLEARQHESVRGPPSCGPPTTRWSGDRGQTVTVVVGHRRRLLRGSETVSEKEDCSLE